MKRWFSIVQFAELKKLDEIKRLVEIKADIPTLLKFYFTNRQDLDPIGFAVTLSGLANNAPKSLPPLTFSPSYYKIPLDPSKTLTPLVQNFYNEAQLINSDVEKKLLESSQTKTNEQQLEQQDLNSIFVNTQEKENTSSNSRPLLEDPRFYLLLTDIISQIPNLQSRGLSSTLYHLTKLLQDKTPIGSKHRTSQKENEEQESSEPPKLMTAEDDEDEEGVVEEEQNEGNFEERIEEKSEDEGSTKSKLLPPYISSQIFSKISEFSKQNIQSFERHPLVKLTPKKLPSTQDILKIEDLSQGQIKDSIVQKINKNILGELNEDEKNITTTTRDEDKQHEVQNDKIQQPEYFQEIIQILIQLLLKESGNKISTFNQQDVSVLVKCFTKLRIKISSDIAQKLMTRTQEIMPELTPQSLTTMSASLSNTYQTKTTFSDALRSLGLSDDEKQEIDQQFQNYRNTFSSLVVNANEKIDLFEEHRVVHLLGSLVYTKLRSEPLFTSIAELALQNPYSPTGLAHLCYYFSSANFFPKNFFYRMLLRSSEKFDSLTHSDINYLISAFNTFKLHPDPFFQLVYKKYNQHSQVTNSLAHQIYNSHLIRTKHLKLPTSISPGHRAYLKKQWNHLLYRRPFQKHWISNELRLLGKSFRTNYVTWEGLLIDVAFVEEKCALLINPPSFFFLELPLIDGQPPKYTPSGKTKLKIEMLEMTGWKVATINFYTFEEERNPSINILSFVKQSFNF